MGSIDTGPGDGKKGALGRMWEILRKPSARYSLLTLLVVGFFGGIFFWGGFNTVVEETNRLEFCISCHEMHDNVYQEYKKTIHWSNRTGVRALCSDCHVPKDWVHKMARKVQATNELYGKMMGTISTPEKFEARRLELARNEWKRMKGSDSRECRNCHSFDGMNVEAQKQRAKKQHEMAVKDKMTCIDCHKGIAHQKPKGMTEADEEG
jgi:cytochrome c-type protein NapC